MARPKSKRYWIQQAIEKMRQKGTLGSLTRSAKRAGKFHKGKIDLSYLKSLVKKGGKMAKKAQFALNLRKISSKK